MKKVLVGISGGVDSSVAAYLLKREYELIGINFSLDGDFSKTQQAKSVCAALQIPFISKDFSSLFKKEVLMPFVDDYKKGKTPNICVNCNKAIKFGALFNVAQELNCDFVATGHYCEVEKTGQHAYLKKAADEDKDQTYFLNQIEEKALLKTLFPLGSLTKPQVREIAYGLGLETADKKGSSDICLAEKKGFKEFIGEYLQNEQGKILSESGEFLGWHKGVHLYTLGQRKGFELGGRQGGEGRWFIIDKNAEQNTITVSLGSEEQLFYNAVLIDLHLINGGALQKGEGLNAKIRYRQKEVPVKVEPFGKLYKVVFNEPVRAPAVGQYCVLYNESYCLGGGAIIKAVKE